MRHPKSTKNRLVRTALECAGVLAFVVAGTAATQAFTPNVQEQVEHFVECFGYMVTDPVTHEAECGPGKAGVWASPVGDGGSMSITTTTDWETTTTSGSTTTSTVEDND